MNEDISTNIRKKMGMILTMKMVISNGGLRMMRKERNLDNTATFTTEMLVVRVPTVDSSMT